MPKESSDKSFRESLLANINRREEELNRIQALKVRLDTLLKETSNEEISKEELSELHEKCENVLSLAKKVAEAISIKMEQEKKELYLLKLSNETALQNEPNYMDEVKLLEQIEKLKYENQKLNNEFTSLEKGQASQEQENSANEEIENWKRKTLVFETKAKETAEELEKYHLATKQESSEYSESALANLQSENEKLIKQLLFFQTTFESDEALARALYKELGAELVPSPNRCGYLTKQGGNVKNWKRRYFVLKDNFLFYYKKPKDETPTGIIHLAEDYAVEEVESEEPDKKNCFKIITKTRTWILRAARQIEMDIWIDFIKNIQPWWTKGALTAPPNKRDQFRKKKGTFRFSTTVNALQPRKS